jgi:hypothetical protein
MSEQDDLNVDFGEAFKSKFWQNAKTAERIKAERPRQGCRCYHRPSSFRPARLGKDEAFPGCVGANRGPQRARYGWCLRAQALQPAIAWGAIASIADIMASAIARSKWLPSFGRSAGARLTVMCL